MFIDVKILNPTGMIFEGKTRYISMPGEAGVFEVLPFHKPLLTRLISGTILVNKKSIPIKRGIAKVDESNVTVIVEE